MIQARNQRDRRKALPDIRPPANPGIQPTRRQKQRRAAEAGSLAGSQQPVANTGG